MSSVELHQTSALENKGDDTESSISVTDGSEPVESNSGKNVFSFGEEPGEAGEEKDEVEIKKKKKEKGVVIDEDEEEDEWSKFTF